MWSYEKRLQYPVNITRTDPQIAQVIISQFGGPDGELAASMRYLSQRYAMPYREVAGLLTDIGTEELAHMEMVSAIVHQLTRGLTAEQIKNIPFANYYVDHTLGLWPQAAAGIPFNACEFQSKGDPITDLHEDMAAEQKARTTYDNILRLIDDPEICDPIRYLREREVVHFQRFGEGKREVSSIYSGGRKPTSAPLCVGNYKFDYERRTGIEPKAGRCCCWKATPLIVLPASAITCAVTICNKILLKRERKPALRLTSHSCP